MIRGLLLAATAAAAFAQPAFAADDRLLQHLFTENEVVRIDGRPGVQATITFGDGEAIENVAVGDSASWQITPNKRADVLFVKPVESGARTNMTVVTDRHTYFFDLVASAKAKPVYLLRFTYRDVPKLEDNGPALAALTPAEQAALGAVAGETPVDPAALNFAWRPRGDTRILPARIYDDGNVTYLLWGEKSQVPAILVLNEKGEEGAVNYSVRGRTIVVDDVPRAIVLRSGKSQATLSNERRASQPAAKMNVPTSPVASAPATVPGTISVTGPVIGPVTGPVTSRAPSGSSARMAPASVVAAASTSPSPVPEN